MKKLLAFLFLFCPLMMFFSSCNCSSYGLEEFLYRTNAVVNRAEKLWNLSSPLIANSEDTAIFSKVSGKKFSVLIMTDVHFGGENNGNNGARQDTLFLSWLENYKSLMESAGTPELYPSFAICLGDVAEHGYEEEFIRYQVFTSLMNTEKYGNIKTFNVVGNHDLYNSGWNYYSAHCYPHVSLYKFRTGAISWYFVDSASGSLGDSQFNTIERDMKYEEYGRKKLVFTHVPAYAGGLFYFVLQNSEERNKFISLLAAENTIALVDGHTHKEITSNLGFTEYNLPGYLEKRGFAIMTVDETNAADPKVMMQVFYLKV